MNQHESPDIDGRGPKIQLRLHTLIFVGSLLAVAISNVAIFRHSLLLEQHYRQSVTEVRPWIWPEGAAGSFLLVWGLAVIACATTAFRTHSRQLRYEALLIGAVALIAVVVNAWFGLLEAFKF
ncbi:MAG: hypothetical protein WBD20_28605 [Pirellulaceae bacterium]